MTPTQKKSQPRPRTVPDKLAHLAGRLTDRDRRMLRLLEEHRVLTTTQLGEVFFDSRDRAEHRLRELTELEVVDRFRPRLPVGSAPYRYVLGPLGAMVLAAEQDADVNRLSYRRDKALSIAYSQRLGHTVGIKGFFTALVAYARRHGRDAELAAWWSEWRCHNRWGQVVRPDGYGRWQQHGEVVDWFLEYDTGTEPLEQVTGKMIGY